MYSKSKVTFPTRNATTLDPHGILNEQSASNSTFKFISGLLIVQALPFSAFLSKSITHPRLRHSTLANPNPIFVIPLSVWTQLVNGLVFGAQNMFWNECRRPPFDQIALFLACLCIEPFALIIHEFSRILGPRRDVRSSSGKSNVNLQLRLPALLFRAHGRVREKIYRKKFDRIYRQLFEICKTVNVIVNQPLRVRYDTFLDLDSIYHTCKS
ncbi:hypothetical protein B0H13DRAFT_1885619 [Mycena leptocephala]|nr:hypothetical protein B0H13DRAFT_1905145 [Mycena leptocephala]KAJ7895409.1 hypothetical protein B0H13DRAFT_1885619 [Mycena leptocephala]